MKVTAKLNNLRISPRKVRLVANLIKDCDIDKALFQLENIAKRSNPRLEKLLNSAVANAESNFGLARDNLYVHNIQVNEGPTLKRWMPRAHGRATTILKRTSNVKLVLEERIEGKGKKSKKQMEEERKQREKKHDIKKKKEITEGKEITEEKIKPEDEKQEKVLTEHKKEYRETESERKQSRESGWAQKIFRRKSG